MEKLQNILLILLLAAFLSLGFILIFGKNLIKKSYLAAESNRPASIFVDGNFVGKIPLRIEVSGKELDVRVVPDDLKLAPVEVSAKAYSGTEVKFLVEFGNGDGETSSVLTYFERTGEGAEISLVSTPDTGEVSLDGQPRGFSPLNLSTSEGKHAVEVNFVGYRRKVFEVEVIKGFRIICVIGLSKDQDFVEVENREIEPKVQYVEILETPTGFLRVREKPNSSSVEVMKVKPGEKYKFLEKDEVSGWLRIEINETKSGWVSGDYSKFLE